MVELRDIFERLSALADAPIGPCLLRTFATSMDASRPKLVDRDDPFAPAFADAPAFPVFRVRATDLLLDGQHPEP